MHWSTCEVATQVAPHDQGILYVAPFEFGNIGKRLERERRAFVENMVKENLVWFSCLDYMSMGHLVMDMTFSLGWYNAECGIQAKEDLKYIINYPWCSG